jgi:Na+/citrate or Na+/malate symporter
MPIWIHHIFLSTMVLLFLQNMFSYILMLNSNHLCDISKMADQKFLALFFTTTTPKMNAQLHFDQNN